MRITNAKLFRNGRFANGDLSFSNVITEVQELKLLATFIDGRLVNGQLN